MAETRKRDVEAYLITAINEYGERFQRTYFPTEISNLKESLERIQSQNRYLSITVSEIYTMAKFERPTIMEPYTYTRITQDGKEMRTVIKNITSVVK